MSGPESTDTARPPQQDRVTDSAAGRHREPPLRHEVWKALDRAAPQLSDVAAVSTLLLFVAGACYSAAGESDTAYLIGDVIRAIILLWIAVRFARRAWEAHGFDELREG